MTAPAEHSVTPLETVPAGKKFPREVEWQGAPIAGSKRFRRPTPSAVPPDAMRRVWPPQQRASTPSNVVREVLDRAHRRSAVRRGRADWQALLRALAGWPRS